jgi:hypothetical protein
MNDRYKELAREAGLLVHNPQNMPTKLSVFAELLIRECAEVAGTAVGDEMGWVAEDVLTHFGVEQ